jgi:hypothetical protein
MNVDYSSVRWRKSTRSGGQGGQCVEVAGLVDSVIIRDSKDPDGPRLAFTHREMTRFATRIKEGQISG